MTLRSRSLVIDLNRCSDKAQVRRATLSCDSSYFVKVGFKVVNISRTCFPDVTVIISYINVYVINVFNIYDCSTLSFLNVILQASSLIEKTYY